MSENDQLTWESLEKLVKELKEEAHTQIPAFYITTHLPFEADQLDKDGKVIRDENGIALRETIHCLQVPAGYWMSAEAADKLQELQKDAKKEET